MNIKLVVLSGIFLIFFSSSFMNGLFFDEDFYLVEFLVLSIFLTLFLYLAIKKKLPHIHFPLVMVILPLILIISFFQASTPLGAIHEILRWMTYVCLFYLMYLLTMTEKEQNIAVFFLLITGLSISIYSFITGDELAGRLAGVFQYPNTHGVLMGAMWLFALSLLSSVAEERIKTIMVGIPVVPFFLSVLLTESRGVWVLLPIIWFHGLLIIGKKKQLYYAFYSILSIGLAILVFALKSQGPYLFWGSFGLAIVLFVLITHQTNKWLSKVDEKVPPYIIPSGFLVLTLAIVLDFVYKGQLYKILPSDLQTRIQSISTGSDTFIERMIMAKDALSASKDGSLIGFGGDAWSVLFSHYQSIPYQTNNLHNGYLEWLINAGWIGLLLFVVVFLYFFIKLYRSSQYSVFTFAALHSLLLVFVHSLMDFNFSYGTIWFFVLTMFAIVLPKHENKKQKTILLKSAMVVLILLVGFSIFTSFRFYQSDRLFDQATDHGTLEEKIQLVDQSLQYNSYDIEKWNALGMLITANETMDTSQYADMIAKKMISLEPMNSKVYVYAVHLLESSGDLIKANQVVDMAIEKDRYNVNLREKSIQLKADIAVSLVKMNQRDKSKEFTSQAIHQYDQFEEDEKTLEFDLPNERFNSRHFYVSEEARYFTAISYFIEKRYKEALSILPPFTNMENDELATRIEALEHVLLERTESTEIRKENLSEKIVSLIEEFLLLVK